MATLPGQDRTILGTAGKDNVKGGKTNDTVRGLGGDDKVNGKKGDDFVLGDTGNDRVKGGQGDDWLLGGEGDDVLRGGKGADQFRIDGRTTSEPDRDIIRDLDFCEGDVLVLFGFAPGTFDDKDGLLETGVGNDLDITGSGGFYGEGARIDSIADLVELVEFSSGVVARQGNGNSLVLEIDGGQTIVLKGLYHDYIAAGGDVII